jgi:hypothetical protein
MNEIVDFLTARLDEDEAVAKASLEAMREPWLDGAGELCAELGCLLLAIDQAGPGHAAGVPEPAGGVPGADVPVRRRGQ